MRKIHLVAVVAVAVLAISAISAASAFAETEWLLNGNPIATPSTVSSEAAELLFIDMKGGVFGEEVIIHCSFLNEETVGPGAADLVTKVTNLSGSNPIECESLSSSCESPVFEAVGLPWPTELMLVGSTIIDLLNGFGWKITCKTIIGNVSDTCAAETIELTVENLPLDTPADVDSTFTNKPPANCSRGGNEQGLFEGSILVWDLEAGSTSLAVS